MGKLTQEYVLKVVASGLKEVTKEIQTLNANLTGSDKVVEKTGKAYDSAGKRQDTYLRGTKGVAHATNNNTKSFSKMAQNVNGTLVPAYATVAANVFALTAAFGALSRAADLQILINAAETLAVQTGRSLTTLSKSMQGITNSAITMKEALTSASIAASAGFDDTTIKNLTQVARNASVALGRNMTDSLDRVFKGAIKAEPELLDELGIILRLDTAARDYAATLGKSAKALTTFEKQQAVVNAVLKQGEEKFGEFADVDVNAYTQLAAAFQDISSSLIQIINVPVTPVLNFLTENMSALTAIIILFSTSVLKRAFPALENFADLMKNKLVKATDTAAKAYEKAKESNISFTRSLQGTDVASQKLLQNFSKGVANIQKQVEGSKRVSKNFKEAFSFGTDSVKGLTAYKKALQQTINTLNRSSVKKSQGFGKDDVKFLREELSETNSVLDKMSNKTIALNNRFQSFGKGAAASMAYAKTQVIAFGSELTKGATRGALAGYTAGFKGISTILGRISKQDLPLFVKGSKLAIATVSGLGGAFLKMVPIIGQLVVAWSLLTAAFTTIRDLIFEKSLVDLSETLDDNTEALNTAAKSAVYYNNKLKDLPDTLDNIEKKSKLLSNTMGTLANNLENTLKDIDIDKGFSGLDSFLDAFALGNLDEFKDQLESINNTLNKFGFEEESNSILKEFTNLLRLSGDEAITAGEKLLKHLTSIKKNASGTLELNTVIKNSLDELSKGITKLNDGLPTLTGLEKGFFNLNTVMLALDTNNIFEIISSMEKLNSFDLNQLGLSNIATDISKIKAPLLGLEEALQKSQKELDKIYDIRAKAASYDDESIIKITDERTEGDFNRLTQQINTFNSAISNINTRLKEQSEGIVKQLDLVRDRFQKIIKAQKDIADIRSKNASSNLEQGKGLEKRLKLLDDLTEAENRYVRTITSQTKIDLAGVKKGIIETTKLLQNTNLDKGTKASLITSLQSGRERKQQLENKLLENRNKISDNYIKQIKVVQKELSKTTKFAAAGLSVSKEQSKIVQEDLYKAYLNLAKAQGNVGNEAINIAAQMTLAAVAVEDFNTFLQKTRMPDISSLIGEASSLDARTEALDIESKYLQDNNVLLSERIDKEFILAKAINDRLITDAEFEIAETDIDPKSEVAIKAAQQLEALQIKGLALDNARDKVVKKATTDKLKGLKDELKERKRILALGIITTKAQLSNLKIQERVQKAQNKGFDQAKELEKVLKDLSDADYAMQFNDGIASMVDGMSAYGSIISNLNNDLENLSTSNQKFTAGLSALFKISTESGNNVSTAFSGLALVVDAYNEKLNVGTMGAGEWAAFTSQAVGAMSQLYEEGSQSAKNLTAVQQTLAIVSATIAILEQAKGDPYTAFARMAAMAATVAGLLSNIGVGFGSTVSGQNASKDYKESIGSQGLVGTDLNTISLIESINDLVSSTTALFSIEHELQVAISGLENIFSVIAASIDPTFGNVDSNSFGVSEGSIDIGSSVFSDFDFFTGSLAKLDPLIGSMVNLANKLLDVTGFGGTTSSTKILDSGIQLGATVQALGDSLVGSLTNASQYLVAEIATTTKSWWGLRKSSSTILKDYYKSLPDTFENELAFALDSTLLVVTDLFRTFGTSVNVNLESLLSNLGVIDISTLKISLKGRTAEEQSDALAAWFSNLGNDVISKVIPFIGKYSLAGEELLDTLIRVTNTTIQLSSAFKNIDLDISAITDVASINFNLMTDAAAEQLKLEMVAAWQQSFISNFTDVAEFTALFDKFSNAIFSETELLDTAFNNYTDTVNAGFTVLRQELTDAGNFDLLNALGTENTDEALRAIYELGKETNAFAAVIDSATGEIDTSGADLFTILIQLGAALDDQSIAANKLEDVLDNLNNQYERQIALFGLIGKELELLELSFNFEDAIKEAEETGTDLVLVETYYGLLRLDIIRKYNQEIVDALKDSMNDVTESIRYILTTSNFWDELAYQSIKITKIVDKLSASFNTFGNFIDFSVFDSISDTTEFLSTLEEFIDVTIGDASTIEDQINLVNNLKDTIIAKYDAEIEAYNDLQDSILDSIENLKDLSSEIGSFLDDLFVGELSPLTNAQKLAEAQTQFDENLQNVISQDSDLAAEARGDLLSSASTLLELANLFWAIGPEYQAIFNNVVGALESIDQNLLEEIGLSEETLAINDLSANFTELQLDTIEQLQTLDQILLVLEEQNAANLTNELAGPMPEVISNLEAITTKLDQVNNDSWNPILAELVALNNTMSNFTMNSFAKGSEEIGYDQVAMIHKGETILTADTSKAIRSGDSIYGTSSAVSNSSDSADVVEAIRILTQVVASGNDEILDKNEELRLATKDVGVNLNLSRIASAKGII